MTETTLDFLLVDFQIICYTGHPPALLCEFYCEQTGSFKHLVSQSRKLEQAC